MIRQVRMSRPVRRVLYRRAVSHIGGDGHPSRDHVAAALQRPTRRLGRAALRRLLFGLAPGGVCPAAPVTGGAGGLLHHRFTLTCPLSRTGGLLSVALFPRVTPGGSYPPPCSVEPGRSSAVA